MSTKFSFSKNHTPINSVEIAGRLLVHSQIYQINKGELVHSVTVENNEVEAIDLEFINESLDQAIFVSPEDTSSTIDTGNVQTHVDYDPNTCAHIETPKSWKFRNRATMFEPVTIAVPIQNYRRNSRIRSWNFCWKHDFRPKSSFQKSSEQIFI